MGLYKIGDRVKVVHFDMLPDHLKNRAASSVDFPEESLLHYSEVKEIVEGYSITITFEKTGAVARFYESCTDFLLREVATGKGAFIYKGRRGAVQAASYAMRMLLQKIEQEERKHGAVT